MLLPIVLSVLAAAVAAAAWFVQSLVRRYQRCHPLRAWEVRVLTVLCAKRQLHGQAAHVPPRAGKRDIDFCGFLLGCAVGDAVGAGVEMVPAAKMKTLPGLFDRYVNLRSEGKQGIYGVNYVSGNYTDDTEHTLANLRALLSGRALTEELLLERYRREYEASRNWLGIGRQGHGGILAYLDDPTPETLQRVRDSQRAKSSPGNAPVMRAAVLGFLPRDQILAAAIANADVTHPHPIGRAASYATALACHFLVVMRGNRRDLLRFVIERLKETPALRHDDFETYLESIDRDMLDNRVLVGSEFGVRADAFFTCGAVLWLLQHMTTPWQLLQNCILIGGDVDSVASVALSIAGGMGLIEWGVNFPLWPLDSLEGVPELCRTAAEFEAWWHKRQR